jgi:hypothetical protein
VIDNVAWETDPVNPVTLKSKYDSYWPSFARNSALVPELAVGLAELTNASAEAVKVRVEGTHDVAVFVGVAVLVGVFEGTAVAVAVGIGVFVGVDVGTGVFVCVGIGVSVADGTAVSVAVGTGVSVEVGTGVSVGGGTGVSVGVGTGVSVDVGTGVSVEVGTGVSVGGTGVSVGVSEGGSDCAAVCPMVFPMAAIDSAATKTKSNHFNWKRDPLRCTKDLRASATLGNVWQADQIGCRNSDDVDLRARYRCKHPRSTVRTIDHFSNAKSTGARSAGRCRRLGLAGRK